MLANPRVLRPLVAAGAVAVALTVTACSGDDDDTAANTDATTTTGAPETLPQSVTTVDGSNVPDPCTFISDADVRELFKAGEGAELDSDAAPITNGKSCVRSATAGEVTSSLVTSIQEGTDFYGESVLPNAQPLEGLGERAYMAADTLGGGLVVSFITDDRTYTVTYGKSGPGDTFTDSASLDAVVELVRTASEQV